MIRLRMENSKNKKPRVLSLRGRSWRLSSAPMKIGGSIAATSFMTKANPSVISARLFTMAAPAQGWVDMKNPSRMARLDGGAGWDC